MNALLDQAFSKANLLSSQEQAALGVTLLALIEEPFMLDVFSRQAVLEGLEQVKEGETLSLEEVRALRMR